MVEWKKIDEVCKTVTPPKKLATKDYQEQGLYPVIDQGQSEVVGFTYEECALLPDGEYVLFGDHTRFVKYHKGKFAQGADGLKILTTKESITPRYFYYAFANTEVPTRGYSRHWSIAKELDIPVPSITEQTRIVGILDTFTAAIDNLKQQIAQRRKQYEYYREKLLDVDEGPEARLITLGEIGTFERGSGIQKKDFVEEGVGCIHYGQIHTYYGLSATETISCISKEQARKCKKAHYGDIIIATTSEDVEGCAKAVAWLGNHDICISGDSLVFHHEENPKYIAYLFRLNYFQRFKRGRCTGAKVTRISAKALSEYPFVLPIRSKQAEIVSNLDTFEDSIRNLEEQLKLREKQYEYYRNKLLTFE